MNKYQRFAFLNNLLKLAALADKKKAEFINLSDFKEKIRNDDQGRERSREEVLNIYSEFTDLAISNNQLSQIESLSLGSELENKLDKETKSFLIIGTVITSGTYNEPSTSKISENIDLINWFGKFFKNKDSEINVIKSKVNFSNLDVLKNNFNELINYIKLKKQENKDQPIQIKSLDYKSNIIIYDFKDGWRVVYLPAAGEMEEYPGLPGTSHDRILEGNKTGLCMGEESRKFQDNESGYLYSLRDINNKPRATIRVDGSKLIECKGKYNLAPDIQSCIKLTEWFENFEGLEYKNNYDYLRFPPLDIDKARKSFEYNPEKAYKDGWVNSWINKGIKELDADIINRIRKKDIILIRSGIAKDPRFKEIIKPVVLYWCNEYLEKRITLETIIRIIFGINEAIETPSELPLDETFMVYRKEPALQLVIEDLAWEYPEFFLTLNLQYIKEYESFVTPEMINTLIEKDPVDFLINSSGKSWINEGHIAKALSLVPFNFELTDFSNLEVIYSKLKMAIPAKFITQLDNIFEKLSNNFEGNPIILTIEEDPFNFLYKYTYISDKWGDSDELIYDDDHSSWMRKEYLDLAVNNAIKKDICHFLIHYSNASWMTKEISNKTVDLVISKGPDFISYILNETDISSDIRNKIKRKLVNRPNIVRDVITDTYYDINLDLEKQEKKQKEDELWKSEDEFMAKDRAGFYISANKYSHLLHLKNILNSKGLCKEASDVACLIRDNKFYKKSYLIKDLSFLRNYLNSKDSERGREVAQLSPQTFLEWLDRNYHEYHDLISKYYDDPGAVDLNELEISDNIFEKYLKDEKWILSISDEILPSWYHMHYERIVKNTWLIHFTDHAWSVAREGFLFGVDDPSRLGLTTYLSDFDKKYGGYNFAFEAKSGQNLNSKKYGSQAVMFKASGILVYHYSDNEYQVIFKGDTANNFIPLVERDGWTAGEFEKEFQDLDTLIDWIKNNFDQYKNLLVPYKKSKKRPN